MTAPVGEASDLTKAVMRLTEVVEDLQEMIRKDYPKRDEIERDFVTKYGIKKRRRQYTILVLASIVAAYFFSMGTVSYCFLSSGNADGSVNTKPICRIVPGYTQSVDNNAKVITTFKHIITTTETNKQRIEQLEKK